MSKNITNALVAFSLFSAAVFYGCSNGGGSAGSTAQPDGSGFLAICSIL